MTPLDEETLNAYCDGALDATDRAAVEQQLQADPEARRFVEAVREADRLAAQAFAEPMQEPPPQALVDAIRASTPGIRRFAPQPRYSYAWPLAAALALAVGIGAGLLLGRASPPAADILALGDVPRQSALHHLLETQPSGSRVEVQGANSQARQVAVIATFADGVGRPCREVELIRGAPDQAPVAAAVACRDGSGAWAVEGGARLVQAAPSGSTQFQPSGAREQDALEGLLTMLGAKSAVTPAEEQAWLQRQWKH